ncbi:hypothetical protein HMPREF1231_0103, partial [Streptococcus pyogenes GA06023]
MTTPSNTKSVTAVLAISAMFDGNLIPNCCAN